MVLLAAPCIEQLPRKKAKESSELPSTGQSCSYMQTSLQLHSHWFSAAAHVH
jgi:hypothetical protein